MSFAFFSENKTSWFLLSLFFVESKQLFYALCSGISPVSWQESNQHVMPPAFSGSQTGYGEGKLNLLFWSGGSKKHKPSLYYFHCFLHLSGFQFVGWWGVFF